MFDRRSVFLGSALIAAGCASTPGGITPDAGYARVGKLKAKTGARDALIDALVAGSGQMPGNISYVVARDAGDPDGVWIFESWRDAESHRASLGLPQVKKAIEIGRPLIEKFEHSADLDIVAGA